MGTENNKRSKRRDRETLQTRSLSPNPFSVPKPGSQLSLLWLRRSLLLLLRQSGPKYGNWGESRSRNGPGASLQESQKEQKRYSMVLKALNDLFWAQNACPLVKTTVVLGIVWTVTDC